MIFPYDFHLFGHTLRSHTVMETLGYAVGARVYFWQAKQERASYSAEQRLWLLVGCVVGALVGAKVLAWVESPIDYWNVRYEPQLWLGAKTIAGGLLGGWLGVEIAKKRLGITRSTGDTFVLPLAIGIGLGRIGCFLTGLPDHTYGVHSYLPWAVDFGDGPRHPTQLYESFYVLLMGIALTLWQKPSPTGRRFRLFMLGYFTFRFFVEFLKPRYTWPVVSISAIQAASLLGIFFASWHLIGTRSPTISKGGDR